jgi:hypothetical protein
MEGSALVAYSSNYCNENDDVYVVIYATYHGKTGHAGIAVDRYKIIYRDIPAGNRSVVKKDTILTGGLVYYDFWPETDSFNISLASKDIPGQYYKLPEKLFQEITLNSLYDIGLPHKENYPSDGIFRIRTTMRKDLKITSVLDSLIGLNRPFNARQYNCIDFVITPVSILLNKTVYAKELILFAWSSTPNKLYQTLKKTTGVETVKDAGLKTGKSFFSQRIIYNILHKNTDY